jgi:valyl-tRNA synthetase
MFGLYLTGEVPFKTVHLHSKVTDSKGQKMSKSKGNVINPLEMTDKFGTDALRMSLVYGIAPASDFVVSEDKIRAQRNFVNKIWNASRFVEMLIDRLNPKKVSLEINKLKLTDSDYEILKKLNNIITSTTKNLNNYRFGQASEDLYQFFWHEFCDVYIESVKEKKEEVVPVLLTVLINSLKLLHPFIPFVTESIYQDLISKYNLPKELFITSSWPITI